MSTCNVGVYRGVNGGLWRPGQETNWHPYFSVTYFCQKVDPLKTCEAKSDRQKKKGGDFMFHTHFNAQIQFEVTNYEHVIGPMSL